MTSSKKIVQKESTLRKITIAQVTIWVPMTMDLKIVNFQSETSTSNNEVLTTKDKQGTISPSKQIVCKILVSNWATIESGMKPSIRRMVYSMKGENKENLEDK